MAVNVLLVQLAARLRQATPADALLSRLGGDEFVLLLPGMAADAAGDLAVMAGPGSVYQRTDAFDFRLVKVQGSVAYAVYQLTSDITDQQGSRHRMWLESMILRRAGNTWRTALLHSTRIQQPGA